MTTRCFHQQVQKAAGKILKARRLDLWLPHFTFTPAQKEKCFFSLNDDIGHQASHTVFVTGLSFSEMGSQTNLAWVLSSKLAWISAQQHWLGCTVAIKPKVLTMWHALLNIIKNQPTLLTVRLSVKPRKHIFPFSCQKTATVCPTTYYSTSTQIFKV